MKLFQHAPRVKQDAVYDSATNSFELGGSYTGFNTVSDAYTADDPVQVWVQLGNEWAVEVGFLRAGTPDTVELAGGSPVMASSGYSLTDQDAVVLTVGPVPDNPPFRGAIRAVSGFSVPDDDDTYVDFDTVIANTGIPWNSTGKYLATEGLYGGFGRVSLLAQWMAPTAQCTMRLVLQQSYYNVPPISLINEQVIDPNVAGPVLVSLTMPMVVLDRVRLIAYQDSGDAVDLDAWLMVEHWDGR
jgi:hypothetical protein